ncbi:MAG: family 16 glycosylhydrolase [Campylobacterota bacterium]|nr:family 16 glycosylhydrolase [Campylobacterota bacterium]
MFAIIKKFSLSFIVLNILILQSLKADILFYYTAAILPSVVSSQKEFETVLYDNFNAYDSTVWRKADWNNGDPFYNGWCPEQVSFENGVMSLTLEELDCNDNDETHASGEYQTKETYKYGRYTARFIASDVNGTISSLFTYTGPHVGTDWDEIDMEILGKDSTKIQVNYWRDGHEHPKLIDLGFDASETMHTYSFVWHEAYIKWYVDGKLIHTVNENYNHDNDSLPINAGKIMLNLWAGVGIESWSGVYTNGTVAQAQYDYVRYEKFL